MAKVTFLARWALLALIVRGEIAYHTLKPQNPLPPMAAGVLFELRAAEMSFWYLISVQSAITTRFGNKFETSKKILKLLQDNYSEPV